ncbi:MAG: YncE family protein [Ignavibacteria bacterium]|nr:MAG: YncE family protein [Ignavibacteria bacterium]
MIKLILLNALLLLIIIGCSETDDSINPPPPANPSGVYVVNEGLFGQNNASLSYKNLEDGSVTNNVYSSANNGNPLGDNANSMTILGSKGYIAVDNSNKVEIINLTDFKSFGFIDLGMNGSPREIYVKDENTAYVTNLNLDQVAKLDLQTKTVTVRINVGSKPEGIREANGKLFVANSGFGFDNTVSVIDMASDIVVATLQVGLNPRFVLNGVDNFIYVVCTGSFSDTTIFSGIYKIDPVANTVVDSIQVKKNPGEACFTDANTMLVINNDGVIKVDLTTKSVSPLISGTTVNSFFGVIYSISYDLFRSVIYCGNPKDFTQNGEVVTFDLNGNETGRFNVGLNPGTIVIK